MIDRLIARRLRLCIALLFLVVALPAQAGNELIGQPSWQSAPPEAVFEQLNEYLLRSRIEPVRQAAIRDLWQSAASDSSAGESDLLERLAACLAKADDHIMVLVNYCSDVVAHRSVPEFAWLADKELPPLVRNNMRLYLARALAQQGYYEEAISWTNGVAATDVIAPDTLLFYRAISHHQLVQADEADAAIGQLLQRSEQLPIRYQKLADLMQQDLAGLEDGSLDHIARRMEDVRRRLAQGDSGERVQQIEGGVVESLDKLIQQVEDQMQQQAQASASSQGAQQAQTPMEESQLAPMQAPGNVDRRDIGRGTGWGDLPDKDREKALQEIGREFPSHYREVIEEYFRRLAADESAEKP